MIPKRTFSNLPAAKQDAIMRVVLEEFSENGYRKTSINTIVGRLGIAKGSIFQYFGDKKSLFRHILNLSLEKVKQYLRTVRDRSADQDFFSRLEATLQAGVDFIHQQPQVYRLYLRVMFETRIPYRQEILTSIRGYSHDYLKSLIQTACERGELRRGIDHEVAAFVLDAVLDRYLQALSINHLDAGLRLSALDAEARRLWIRKILDLFRQGLAATNPADRHPRPLNSAGSPPACQ